MILHCVDKSFKMQFTVQYVDCFVSYNPNSKRPMGYDTLLSSQTVINGTVLRVGGLLRHIKNTYVLQQYLHPITTISS